jgi:hypothetical protein
VTRHSGVVTSVGGETTLGGGKEEDDTNWTDMNLTVLKNKKRIHVVNSVAINGR